ncbi:helix-turn-helix domain-containing protein [Vulcanococcus limneticus]|uniref:helix-turn-helix domain-containing protein n=1 Tax=Vulcanococcus limneticus TaxID=2170428 RepID=UPI00398BDC4D
MVALKPQLLREAPGLRTVLHSHDFDQWEALVASTLGHHRSRLLAGSVPFESQIRCGAVEEFQVLLLHGRGALELVREQCGHGVLWLPLQGLTLEQVNGVELLAEPGLGLLVRPGDVLRGTTTEAVTGVSILIPAAHLDGPAPTSPLLVQGRLQRQLIAAGLQLAQAAAWQPQGSAQAAALLVEALRQWRQPPDARQGPPAASRRRALVLEACQWMAEHLAERFSVADLGRALGVSVRTLQYSFQQELGCTPMAQARRLRLRRLRRLLQDPAQHQHSIAELMAQAGLLACGATAADYRLWCGESPRRTRRAGAPS